MNGARYAYLQQICNLVDNGHDIVLVSADYAAPTLDDFRKRHPERYLSVGIAEQNLIQVACGLAMAGKQVVAYGMAPFPVLRGFDPIKNAVSMMHIPLHLACAGVGFAIPEWGATHYNIEDFAIMRTLPNMKILTVTDEVMARVAADNLLSSSTPMYLRFDKYADGTLYPHFSDLHFEKGYHVVRPGKDMAVITSACHVRRLFKILDNLGDQGARVKLIDLYAIPFQKDSLLRELQGVKLLLSIEENALPGGMGSLLLEFLSDHKLSIPIRRIGIDFIDAYPSTFGSREYYWDTYGLSDDSICRTLWECLDALAVPST